MQTQTTTSRIPADRLPEYVNDTERAIAALIVSELITAGYSLSVFDGEEWTVKQSRDAGEVCAALASTDADTIRARVPADTTEFPESGRDASPIAGSVTLIWGNGRDLLSDCGWTANERGHLFSLRLETLADMIDARWS